MNAWGIPREEAEKSILLTYEYFMLDKTEFTEKQAREKVRSAYNWEPENKKIYLIPNIDPDGGEHETFIINKKNNIIVCLHNTQIILDILEIELYYDVIKKRPLMKSPHEIFKGTISDYHVKDVRKE